MKNQGVLTQPILAGIIVSILSMVYSITSKNMVGFLISLGFLLVLVAITVYFLSDWNRDIKKTKTTSLERMKFIVLGIIAVIVIFLVFSILSS